MVTETLHTLVCEFENAAFEHTQALRTEREPRMSNATSALHLAREDLMAHLAGLERDAARLDWLEAQFADHNRDCNVTLIRWQYDRELALDVEGASWSRMNVREALDAARGVG